MNFKPYFVSNKETKKNIRKVFIINKLLKTKVFINNENKIKVNNEEKSSVLVFPIIF